MTLFFKACPRCQGDMHMNRDIYGDYKECLACGMMEDIEKESMFAKATAGANKKLAKVAKRSKTPKTAKVAKVA